MKVIQINSMCKSGSVSQIAIQIQKILLEQGDDSSIAYGRGTSVEGVTSHKFSSEIGVRLHVVLNRVTDKHGLYSKFSTKKLIKYLRVEKPDIVHLHCVHGYYVNYELLFAYFKEIGLPVVWTFHDCWAITGHCAFFDLVGCDKWKTGCYNCPSKKEYPASFFLDSSDKNYEKKIDAFTSTPRMIIVTPSIWLKNVVAESFLSKYETVVINNGIDCQVFKPIEDKDIIEGIYKKYLNDYDKKKIILGVANIWSRRKGLEDFVKLSQILSQEFQIILVGLTKRQIKQLPENIIGVERTNSANELAALYSGAYCFLNLTYDDNYPTTNIEALSCGTPVITYDTGGSGEMIEKEYIVKKGDLHSVAKLIKNNDFKRINVGDKFDAKYCFQKYLELYRRIHDFPWEDNLSAIHSKVVRPQNESKGHSI